MMAEKISKNGILQINAGVIKYFEKTNKQKKTNFQNTLHFCRKLGAVNIEREKLF